MTEKGEGSFTIKGDKVVSSGPLPQWVPHWVGVLTLPLPSKVPEALALWVPACSPELAAAGGALLHASSLQVLELQERGCLWLASWKSHLTLPFSPCRDLKPENILLDDHGG